MPDHSERPPSRDAAAGVAARVQHGIRRAVRTDATAFGYSILITATFGAADLQAGPVTVWRLVAFALGATVAFAVLEAVVSRGFRVRIREERSSVVLIGTALAPVSVVLGLLTGVAAVSVVPGTWAWAAAPFAATGVYVLLAGAQLALARVYEERYPPDEQE